MNEEQDDVLMHCLYFTASRFSRSITKLAEKYLDAGGLAPSYFYMIMVIHFKPGITQKELCQKLAIAPSTSTRFIDKLEKRNIVLRKMSGKQTFISLTDEGDELYQEFRVSIKELFDDYSQTLGKDFSLDLSRMLHEASLKLEKE